MYKSKKITFIQHVAYCISIIFFMIVVAGCTMYNLHKAIEKDDFEAAKLYIEEKNTTMCSSVLVKGLTPLSYTAYYDRPEITELLIKKGVDINKKSRGGWTPLAKASEIGNFEVVKLLVENGAKIDKGNNDFETPLLLAIENDNFEVVKFLVENGAKIDAKNIDGWTPIVKASKYGHFEVVKLLVENGADVNTLMEEGGWTPLLLAADGGYPEIVKLLVENGANIDAKRYDGWTPLIYAAYEGHTEIVKLLIDKGANINAKKVSQSAIYIAAKNDRTKIVRYLLEAEADTRIIPQDAHDFYSAATISNIMGLLYEENEDSSKAIESYQVAAKRFEKASEEYKIMAKNYRLKAVGKSIARLVVTAGEFAYAEKHDYQRQLFVDRPIFYWDNPDLTIIAKQCDKRVEICKQLADSCKNSANSLL